jgi:hypothetical protein
VLGVLACGHVSPPRNVGDRLQVRHHLVGVTKTRSGHVVVGVPAVVDDDIPFVTVTVRVVWPLLFFAVIM